MNVKIFSGNFIAEKESFPRNFQSVSSQSVFYLMEANYAVTKKLKKDCRLMRQPQFPFVLFYFW